MPPHPRASLALVTLLAAACSGDDAASRPAPDAPTPPIDAPTSPIDAPTPPIDAPAGDAPAPPIDAPDTPLPDASVPDAAVPDAATPIDAIPTPIDAPPPIDGANGCHVLDLTAAQACAIAYTGRITACSITGGTPSDTGSLEVRRPDGQRGYVCAFNWTEDGGHYFGNRTRLVSAASSCCGGPSSPQLPWPAARADLGVPHAPTHVDPQEQTVATGGDIRHNPFTIIVSSPSAAAAYQAARAQWQSWSGDGQPHPAPDGTGAYYFPAFLVVNYLVLATSTGDPLIVIAPEPTLDAAHTLPLGHPTLGACAGQGGAPLAFIGGDIQGTTLTNGSGRYGFESTIVAANLDAAAALFNCYGIPINAVIYNPPS